MTNTNEDSDIVYRFHDPQPIEWPTLRDQFAMAALIGILASDHNFTLSPEKAACWACEYADAMLKARKE